MPIQSPKGTRDFYPEDMVIQNHLLDLWKKSCRAFGYEEYEGPSFEHLDLYVGKSGAEIVDQLYHFKDKAGRDLALRPEMTPTLARMVNQKGPSLAKPFRWFSIPRLYRYERAQRGRLREFFQLNMDVVGCVTIAAEIDLLTAIIEMMKNFGLNEMDFSIRISSRDVLSVFLDGLGVHEEQKSGVYAALDKRDKIGMESFNKLLLEKGLDQKVAAFLEMFFQCKALEDVKSLLPESVHGDASFSRLEQLWSSMNDLGYGNLIQIDTSVVRGLAYYTGIVFEVYDLGKNRRAIAGGGRYDGLLQSLGGHAIPAVGFGMGDVVLSDLLREKNLLPRGNGRVDYYLADLKPSQSAIPRVEFLSLAKNLRARGKIITYSLNQGKLKGQLADANRQGAKTAIFFNSDRAPDGSYECKSLDSGEQRIVREQDL